LGAAGEPVLFHVLEREDAHELEKETAVGRTRVRVARLGDAPSILVPLCPLCLPSSIHFSFHLEKVVFQVV
jgi:hypothetical protein